MKILAPLEFSSSAVGQMRAVDSGSYFDIRPATGVELVIQNVFYDANTEEYTSDSAVEIYFVYNDGVSDVSMIKFASRSRFSPMLNCKLPVTNNYFVRIKNISPDVVNVGYSGMRTI